MMQTKETNANWENHWPEETAATALLEAAALFHLQALNREFAAFQASDAAKAAFDIRDWELKLRRLLHRADSRANHARRQKTLKTAAVILLISLSFLLTLPTVLFAVSADFREAVQQLILDWRPGNVGIDPGSDYRGPYERYYLPGYLPEGFVLMEYSEDEIMFELHYESADHFINIVSSVFGSVSTDTDHQQTDLQHQINGQAAVVLTFRDEVRVTWYGEKTMFEVTTNLSQEETLKIASNLILTEIFP